MCPTVTSCCSIRDGKRTSRRRTRAQGDPQERCVRPPPRGARSRLRHGGRRPDHHGLGRRDTRRARTERRSTGPSFASCDIIIHSAAAVSFDSPLDSAVEINLLGPSRIADLCNEIGITPHLVAVSTCYVAGNRRGNAPEILVSDGPFDIGIDWRSEVAASRRLRSDCDAASREPERLVKFRADARAELGAAGAPALAIEDRTAPRALGEGPTRRGRASSGRQRRLAGRLRVHQGARRAGAHRREGRRAGLDRATLDHRVGARRAEAGLDPRLPHGRARDHLLRPRTAQRIPRRPGGHGRRHPGRPRRRHDHRRRRARTRAGAGDHPDRVGRDQPAEVPHARRQRQRLVPRASGVRRQGPADRGPRMAVHRTWPRAGPTHSRQDDARPRREGPAPPAAPRAAGRVGRADRDEADGGRAGADLRRAVRALHRVRGDLPGRQSHEDLGRPRRDRPPPTSTSTRAASTGRPTSPRSTSRRSSSTPA